MSSGTACNGTTNTCISGSCVACTSGYKDYDKDGYGYGTYSCWTTSSSYNVVANNTDCYDSNANARPGQTSYFATNRGDGSFDYDCDGGVDANTGYSPYSVSYSTSCSGSVLGSSYKIIGYNPPCVVTAPTRVYSVCNAWLTASGLASCGGTISSSYYASNGDRSWFVNSSCEGTMYRTYDTSWDHILRCR